MTKRHKTLSVLIIPEGEQQTFSLKIKYAVLKFLLFGFAIACVVLILGSISYWKLTQIAWDYDRLAARNEKLLQDNLIINDITGQFQSIQAVDKRIRNLFGDLDFQGGESQIASAQLSDNARFIIPGGRENSYKLLNPFLRADILSAYPTLVPVEGEISQFFTSEDAVTGRGHFGVDLSAREGSVIVSAADGIVIFSNWTFDAGNQVIIDHQNGYMSIYKHNASLLIQERAYVYQGEPIALVGNSGISSAPHLHIEIWKNYVPIDPLTLWQTK